MLREERGESGIGRGGENMKIGKHNALSGDTAERKREKRRGGGRGGKERGEEGRREGWGKDVTPESVF